MSNGYRIGRLKRKRANKTTYQHYVMQWTDDSGSHRVSLGTDDRQTAEALARDLWSKRTLANIDTVGKIMLAFLNATDGQKGNKRNREAWNAAAEFWKNVRPCRIDPDMCRKYANQRKRAANTIRNELSAIRSGLKWAMVKPAATMWMPPMPESSVHHLSKDEFRRFLKGCSAPHVRLFAQLAVTTGGRATALLQLRWARVDFKRRLLDLCPAGVQQIANKGRAIVPINEKLLPLLEEARKAAQTDFVIEYQDGPIACIRKGFEAASERSGVHCTPHMLRHSAAVWMAEARVPMEEIARFLGHKNTTITTRVYARFHPDYLQRAAKALTW